MPKVTKPASIRLPDGYSLRVRPNTTVRIGTDIIFELTYKTGNADEYQPSLELLRDPDTHPERPRRLGLMRSKGSIGFLGFTVDKLGTYAFKVKPFLNMDFGELVEIHTISSDEVDSLKSIADRFARHG